MRSLILCLIMAMALSFTVGCGGDDKAGDAKKAAGDAKKQADDAAKDMAK